MRWLVIAAALFSSVPAFAQERGTDVGGQPARRKITRVPKLVRFVEAAYPAEEKAAGRSASVVLTLDISATGAVTRVVVAESAGPAFDAAAQTAASQFVFEPAEVDDKPAPSRITYRYDFVLKDEAPDSPPPSPLPPPSPPPPPSPLPSPSPPSSPVEEVEVRGRPRASRETNQTTIRAERAKKVAGTQGDVLKVVQNLPGVSRPPVASGQIVVWGSAPRETRVYVDGVDLPALYHGSGLRGTINSDLVASVDLVPGAFGAEYGRGLGGLVRVETRPLSRGTHGYVGVDTLDGSALISTELSDRVRVATAFRYGWLDRVLAATSVSDGAGVADRSDGGRAYAGDFFPVPRYRDAQVKATVDLRRREAIDAVVLASGDDLDRTVPSADPAKTRVESTSSGFWRAYARYTRVDDAGDPTIVTPFVGQDRSRLSARFGGAPSRLDVDSDRYGLRASTRSRIGSRVMVVIGMDVLGTSSKLVREGSLTLPPREGDIAVFGQPPGDELAVDRWSTHVLDVGPNVHADVKLGPFTITPGLRGDAYLIEGSQRVPRIGLTPPIGFSRMTTAIAPRASARWDTTERLAFTAAYGQYHQPPDPEDLSAVFGTPDLALSRATHVSAGESLRIARTTTAEIVAFHKTLKDLVVRSRLVNPIRARALTQNGEGRSYGVQFLVRQELWHGFFGWVSYAVSRSERRYDGQEDWRRFDFDQPHVLSVVGFQEIGKWGVGMRFRYASGNPRTPVVGSAFDARSDRFDPVFGPHNGIRLPAFWQLDVRAERTFALGRGVRLLLFADIQNVTNRENAEEIVYSSTFRRRDTIKGLPALAVIGARLEL